MIDREDKNTPRIWAVGGGKGGVGKSVIAANLGVALARQGNRVVALDADLGGANLHTLFGMPNPPVGLSDFVTRRVEDLNEVRVPTPIERLWLVSGARALLEMANPNYGQKGRLLRHIAALDADHVVIDIGAGSAFNVLDFFLFAHRGILVVVPEPTSIENAYHFLKAAFYRKLKNAEPKARVRARVKAVMAESEQRGIRSPRDLIRQVALEDSVAGEGLETEARSFTPGIVVNRARLPEHRKLGEDIGLACRDYFGTEIDYLGHVEDDLLVNQSVTQRRPHLEMYPGSQFSRAIEAIAGRLVTTLETSDD